MYKIIVLGMLPGPNGVSTSIMNLYRNIDRTKIQWIFVMYKEFNKASRTKAGNFAKEIEELGGSVYFWKYSVSKFPYRARKKLEELMLSDPEIMGVHFHDLGTNTYPLYLANKLNKPIKIIQFHSACVKYKVDDVVNGASLSKKTRLRMISDDSYDRWACSDLGGRVAYLNYSFEVFPNAVDTKKFSFNPLFRQLIRTKLQIPLEATVFGFVASIYNLKNPMFAVKVFEKYRKYYDKNAHMILIGGGPDLVKIIEYSKKKHLIKRLHILGQQLEIDMFYSAFDIFLCPSLYEGFPNVLVEAQSSGNLCLVSDQITEMVKLTELVDFFSLKCSEKKWAEKAHNMIINAPPRRSWDKEVKEAGYDIKDVGQKLTDYYLKKIKQWKKQNKK